MKIQEHMYYDEYLAAGYPVGSGVVEGACRHLVKDRLELTGMRWEREGAQSMLHLRAIYLNREWNQFVNDRIQAEQAALYGQGTVCSQVAYPTACEQAVPHTLGNRGGHFLWTALLLPN